MMKTRLIVGCLTVLCALSLFVDCEETDRTTANLMTTIKRKTKPKTTSQIILNEYLKQVEEEKMDVYAFLQDFKGLQREKVLVGLVAQERMARRRENDANIQKAEMSGDKNRLIDTYKNIILWWSCGKDLRYRMEVFGVQFGHKGGLRLEGSLALTEALNNIKSIVKERRSKLQDSVSILVTLYAEFIHSIATQSSEMPAEWKERFKKAYNTLKTVTIVQKESELLIHPTLSSLIMEILTASDAKNATEIFQKQCDHLFWSQVQFDHLEEHEEIKKLATLLPKEEKKDLIDNFNKKTTSNLGQKDRKFLKGLLDSGTYFIKNNKRYESCAEVLYFAPSKSIQLLEKALEKQWPDVDFITRVDNFCDAFTNLYDIISISDIYAPMNNLYISNCTVSSEYFYDYLKSVIPDNFRMDKFVFVSKVLGKISFDFTIPLQAQ